MSDSRRNFLLKSFSASSAAWLAANWPAQVAAAEKAQAMGAFTYFSREQAVDIDAMAAQCLMVARKSLAETVAEAFVKAN